MADDSDWRAGILLYTGTPGSEGTLGGLVEVGRNILHHLRRAAEMGLLCSNDPVCAQHEPHGSEEGREREGAACHGCVLIGEPSCERMNRDLDRTFVVPTVEEGEVAFLRGLGPLMEWLTTRSDADLALLLQALQSRRLRTPLTATRLRSLGLSGEWAGPIQALLDGPWSTESLAAAIDWVISERTRARIARPKVVSTHPGVAEPGFVDTSVVLRRLFQNATSEVLLAGFRVTDHKLLEQLTRREAERLNIRIFFHIDGDVDPRGWKRRKKGPIDPDAYPVWWWREFLDKVWPPKIDPPQGYYSPLTLTNADGYRSMHIKTAVVDRRQWLVTSANFTSRAQSRNMELGVLIEDGSSSTRVIHHFEMQLAAGVFVPFPQLPISS